jgi:hypothetical protein
MCFSPPTGTFTTDFFAASRDFPQPRGSLLLALKDHLTPATKIAPAASATPSAARRARKPRAPKITCEDCYFSKNLLCALDQDEPCPTFRAHEQGLTPPQQLSFVFRQERTRSAWVFEQPR